LSLIVDEGEAEAMALSLELGLPLLIDDQKGRKVAEKLGLKYIGTLGLLKIAKKKGIISTVKPFIDSFINCGYYLDKKLVEKFLKDLGEI
jgi:predicted nucleic acid-binding protein